jgi:hypothetical protein
VPAKTTRIDLGCDAGALLLFHLRPNARLLEAREVLDEHLPLEVIHLVLDADRKQALGFQLERLPGGVQRAHFDLLGALDNVINSGHRKAALFTLLLAVPRDDFRVDEDDQLVAGVGDVDHEHSLVDIHLRGREPDAGGGVHRLRHVPHQPADRVVDLLHRFGHLVKPGVGIAEDAEHCHKLLAA